MVRVNRFVQSDRVADRLTATLIKEELLPAYRQSLDSIRAEVGLLYEKHAKDGVLSMSDVTQYNRLKNTEKRIAAEMGRLRDKQVRTTSKTIKGVYEESFYRTAYAIEFEAQAKLRFGELPSKQVDAAIVNPMDRIGWKDRTLEGKRLATRQVREEITQGIIQGKGYPEVAREVKKRMDIAAYRAERIVRTEAHRAREEGKLASLEHAAKEGVEMEKVWTAALDERTRDSHQGLDGQAVPVFDEDGNPGVFISPVTGATAEYPGGFGVAEEDINCRCAAAGQIMGYGPEVRRARLTEEEYQEAKDEEAALAQKEGRAPRPIPRGKVVPYQTYPQYADAKGWPRRYKGPEPTFKAGPDIPVRAEVQDLLYSSRPLDRPGHFPRGYDVLEDELINFTAGGSGYSETTTAILKGKKVVGELPQHEAVARRLLQLIDDAPRYQGTLFRIEELGANPDLVLRTGHEFKLGMRSFSRSRDWARGVVAGESDVDFLEPIILQVKGAKSINLAPYSPYFREQMESATAGTFKVLGVRKSVIGGVETQIVEIAQLKVL